MQEDIILDVFYEKWIAYGEVKRYISVLEIANNIDNQIFETVLGQRILGGFFYVQND